MSSNDKMVFSYRSYPDDNQRDLENVVSYNFESDFYTNADAFTVVVEDVDASQLLLKLGLGSKMIITLNNHPQMVGYVDDIGVSKKRGSGTKVVITGRDLLGQAAQGHVLPNMGTNDATNFHFSESDTFETAFKRIFNNFQPKTQIQFSKNDDRFSLQLKTGGLVGVRKKLQRGSVENKEKYSKQTRSFSDTLKHILQPNPGDTFLVYANKLAKCLGCNIKTTLDQNLNEIINIGPPCYDRTIASAYNVFHTNDPKLSKQNTIIDAKLKFSIKDQYTAVIGQLTGGIAGYKKVSNKVIGINEITGLIGAYEDQNGNRKILPNLDIVLKELTTNKGYSTLENNEGLLAVLDNLPVTIDAAYSRPLWHESYSAHESQELSMEVREMLEMQQSKFFDCEYLLKGHTYGDNNLVWVPNQMCKVYDSILSPAGNPLNTNLWIEKVNLTRTREDGPMTNIKLNLPYLSIADVS